MALGMKNWLAIFIVLYPSTQIFPVNRLALVAGMAAVEDLDYAYSNIKQVCIERENLSQSFKEIVFLSFSNKFSVGEYKTSQYSFC